MSRIWWSLSLRPLKTNNPLVIQSLPTPCGGLLRRANNQLLDGLGELLLQLGSSGGIKFVRFSQVSGVSIGCLKKCSHIGIYKSGYTKTSNIYYRNW